MSLYHNRPKIVEVQQFHISDDPDKYPVGVKWGGDLPEAMGCYFVVTIHGQPTPVADGDYIITEPDGIHHYPCKPDIFEKSYEPVQ